MKNIFSLLFLFVYVISSAQQFPHKKDTRPASVKEDPHNIFQATSVDHLAMLKILEIAGLRTFNFTISPAFTKDYKIAVMLNEYDSGKLINTKDIIYTYQAKNLYTYFEKDSSGKDIGYVDFLSKLTFYSKEHDTLSELYLETVASRSVNKLKKKKDRPNQFYNWRTYSHTPWILNKEVPLLVFASSWFDKRINADRFCGTVDLSRDPKETKELLDESPHYYVITLKVFDVE